MNSDLFWLNGHNMLLLPILIAVILGTLRLFTKNRWMNWIELLSMAFFTVIVLFFQRPAIFVVGGWSSAIGVEVKYDSISFWFIFSLLIVWSSVKMRFEKWEPSIESMLDYLFASMYALFISNDLFNIYVTIELTSLISFLLVGHGKKPSRVWAALKYMLLSAVALNTYLFGTLIVYYGTGVLALGALKLEKIPEFGLALILTALLVKSGILGLSAWIVDAYSKSETPVSMVLSGIVVNAGIFAIIRIYDILPSNLKTLVLVIGIISTFGGAIYAFGEKNFKRILAFSTTSQMGISLIVLGVSPIAAAIYAFFHSNTKALLFSKNGKISTTIGALSLAGMPPLAGYFAKIAIGESHPMVSILITFVTSVYVANLFGPDLKWKFSPFEIPLEFAILSLMFLIPFGGVMYTTEILATIAIGILVGKRISFPNFGDPFELEEGLAYQMAFLAIAALTVVKW